MMDRSQAFAVPWALNLRGRLVHASTASKDEEPFRCPVPTCEEPRLILRAGAIRVRHFAHLGKSGCAPESVEHWAAKLRIAEVVADWVAGRSTPPVIVRTCGCGGEMRQRLPERVRAAKVEVGTGGLRPDVLLVDSADAPVAAVEVFVTHAVDDAKAARLAIPCIEVCAAEILADPLAWSPRQAWRLLPIRCDHAPQDQEVETGDDRSYYPGEYDWVIETGAGSVHRFTSRYKSSYHAFVSISKYLARGLDHGFYSRSDTIRVTGECEIGTLRGTWRDRRWITRLAVNLSEGVSES
jgi:hypothetical protein